MESRVGRSTMRSHMALDDFLVAAPKPSGVTHLFGLQIPQDDLSPIFRRCICESARKARATTRGRSKAGK